MRTMRVVVKEDEDGGFYVYSPDLKGCVSQGETEAEALRNFAEALEGWLAAKTEKQRQRVRAAAAR